LDDAPKRWLWICLGLGGATVLLLLDTRAGDALITSLFQSAPSWTLLRAAEALTVFGSVQLTAALVFWVAWAAGRRHGWRAAMWILFPFVAALPLEFFVKMWGSSVRAHGAVPLTGVLWAWFRVPPSSSFPSGHMLRATYVVGLLLAWEAATRESPRRPISIRLAALAGLFVFAASQVYIGNHWASDLGGGFLLGVVLAVMSSKHWRW